MRRRRLARLPHIVGWVGRGRRRRAKTRSAKPRTGVRFRPPPLGVFRFIGFLHGGVCLLSEPRSNQLTPTFGGYRPIPGFGSIVAKERASTRPWETALTSCGAQLMVKVPKKPSQL